MRNLNNVREYIFNSEGTIHNGYFTSARFDKYPVPRLDRAKEQAELKPASIDTIIKLTNKFLLMCGISCVKEPRVDSPKGKLKDSKAFYEQIMRNYKLNDKRDIVWMKFSDDGFLGVVASSIDINFLLPISTADYAKTNDGKPKSENNDWIFNNSGIIIHRLDKKWCEDYLLVFPLSIIPDELTRSHIECGIGNFLIANNVPLLDYYSHRFQPYFYQKRIVYTSLQPM